MNNKYSILNNLKYVLNGMHKYGKNLLLVQILGVIVDGLELFLVPVLVKFVIQYIEDQRDIRDILTLIGIYALVFIIINVSQGLILNQSEWKMRFVLIRFKRELMATMLSMKYANMENSEVLDEHEKIRNVMNNKDAGIEGMMNSSVRCGKFIIQMVIAAVLISRLSIWLTLTISIILFLASIPIDNAKKKDKEKVWDALGPYWRRHFNLGFLTQNFMAAKEIRLYSMKEWIYRKYLSVNKDIQEKYIISRNIWHKCHFIVKILEFVQEIVLYLFLLYAVYKGNMTIADFTLYISSVHIFSKAVNDFMNEFADIKKQSLDVADFRGFIDLYSTDDSGVIEKNESKPLLKFSNVTFGYEGQTVNALDEINIEIPYGQRLAVVGLNGAGKTTFIKLLCGLYKPSSGTIYIANKNAESLKDSKRFGLFAPVFQNIEVYPFTVAENISMKALENTDINRVNECLKMCGLYNKIQSLRYKEKTQMLNVIDEKGVDLSGGEKQKLALARALYKDSPIIILDEPTSALDPLAEEQVYKSFDKLIGNKTGIYISHRLSSTKFCDKIAVFSNGKIVEYGTHEELMSLQGEYYNIFEAQAQYYREGDDDGNDEEYA